MTAPAGCCGSSQSQSEPQWPSAALLLRSLLSSLELLLEIYVSGIKLNNIISVLMKRYGMIATQA